MVEPYDLFNKSLELLKPQFIKVIWSETDILFIGIDVDNPFLINLSICIDVKLLFIKVATNE